MIHIEQAEATDLETIISIQRASFKSVYEKYHDQYDPYLEDRERIKWKLVERPNSFYYFVKDDEEIVGFLRLQTNDERTKGLGQLQFYLNISEKAMATKEFAC